MSGKTDLQIVISHGQSLSLGASSRFPISTTAILPGSVLSISTSSSGQPILGDLVATRSEMPIISALNTVAASFLADGIEGPTLIGLATGTSGKPLISLLLSSEDRRTDVATGLASTTSGSFFYTANVEMSRFDILLNDNGTAKLALTTTYEPNLFDPVVDSLRKVKLLSDEAGFNVTDTLVFSFIQGQSDSSDRAGVSYSKQLELLVARVDATAETILQKPIDTLSIIGQTRNAYPANEQMKFVKATSESYLGALEFPYQAQDPSSLNWKDGELMGSDSTHLNDLGYFLLGQETGHAIYEVLTGAREEDDFLSIGGVSILGNKLTVSFDGLRGTLVDDPSVFSSMLTGPSPEHFGFSLLGDSAFRIIQAEITSDDTVTLTLNRLLNASLQLRLGSSSGFGGTSLRDSFTRDVWNPYEVPQLEGREIKKFVPAQTLDLPVMAGGSGNDHLVGTGGDDLIFGNSGEDTVLGQGGHDLISGGHGNDLLDGGAGNDTIMGEAGRDTINGGDGDDLVIIFGATAASDQMSGGAGTDTLRIDSSSGPITLASFASNGFEILDTGGKPIEGNSVSNTLDMSGFADVIGIVLLRGLGGHDLLIGSSGADQLEGGAGNDSLLGGDGDDLFILRDGEAAGDQMTGGGGYDTIIVGIGSGAVTIARLSVDIEAFNGSGQIVIGTSAGNLLDFSTFASVTGVAAIRGLSGNDTIRGTADVDVIEGGTGNDVLFGGAGNDAFVFSAANHSVTGRNSDTIIDFEGAGTAGGDVIDLRGLATSLVFIGTGAFAAGETNQVRFTSVGGDTLIQIDNDTSTDVDAQIRLTGIHTLTADDFLF